MGKRQRHRCDQSRALAALAFLLLGCGDTYTPVPVTGAPEVGTEVTDTSGAADAGTDPGVGETVTDTFADSAPDDTDTTDAQDGAVETLQETTQDLGPDGTEVSDSTEVSDGTEVSDSGASDVTIDSTPEATSEPEPDAGAGGEPAPETVDDVSLPDAEEDGGPDAGLADSGPDATDLDDGTDDALPMDDGPGAPEFVAATPPGTLAFMDGDTCPPGWERATQADGRLLKATSNSIEVGVTSGVAVVGSQPSGHAHGFTMSATLGSQGIAAVSGCCNDQAASAGGHTATGQTDDDGTGLPMVERLLCRRLDADEPADTHPFPEGAIFFVDALQCPNGWSSVGDADGRLVVPTPDGGTPGVTVGEPLGSGVAPLHSHGLSASITPGSVSFAAFGGGNQSGAKQSTVALSGSTDDSAGGIAYIQYRLCRAPAPQTPLETEAADIETVPAGLRAFYESAQCPQGWVQATAKGTFLMALSAAGAPGSSYGSGPLDPGEDRVHTHLAGGNFTLSSTSFAIAGGCCNGGFSANGSFPWSTTTDAATSGVPYLTLTLCQKANE